MCLTFSWENLFVPEKVGLPSWLPSTQLIKLCFIAGKFGISPWKIFLPTGNSSMESSFHVPPLNNYIFAENFPIEYFFRTILSEKFYLAYFHLKNFNFDLFFKSFWDPPPPHGKFFYWKSLPNGNFLKQKILPRINFSAEIFSMKNWSCGKIPPWKKSSRHFLSRCESPPKQFSLHISTCKIELAKLK